MSARRAARAAATKNVAAGVPVELADPDHRVWRSAEDTAALAAAYGLPYTEPEPSIVRDPYWRRFDAVRDAYCAAHGLMSETYKASPDWHRLRAVGIYASHRAPRFVTMLDGTVVPVRHKRRI